MSKEPDWNDKAAEIGVGGIREALDATFKKTAFSALPWLTARQLQKKTFAPIKFVVPDYIAEGCTLFAGRPKIGKSWLMLEVGLGVAMNRDCLGGIACEPGAILYLALEDNERRLQRRITKLIGAAREDWPENLHYATEWPRLKEGGLERLREWIEKAGSPRLIVVDVLAMVRSPAKANEIYQADYETVMSVRQVSLETGVAIVVVTHVRKGKTENDPFEKISGTLGLSGAADTVLILDGDSSGTTIYGRGRDIEEIETAVSFDKETCRWRVLGSAVDVRRSDQRTKILAALLGAAAAMTPGEIAITIDHPRNNVDQLLYKMLKGGEVLIAARGKYVHPDRLDLVAQPRADKNDKTVRKPSTEDDENTSTAAAPNLTSYRSYQGKIEDETSASASQGKPTNEACGARDELADAQVNSTADRSAAADDDWPELPEFLNRAIHPRPDDDVRAPMK